VLDLIPSFLTGVYVGLMMLYAITRNTLVKRCLVVMVGMFIGLWMMAWSWAEIGTEAQFTRLFLSMTAGTLLTGGLLAYIIDKKQNSKG